MRDVAGHLRVTTMHDKSEGSELLQQRRTEVTAYQADKKKFSQGAGNRLGTDRTILGPGTLVSLTVHIAPAEALCLACRQAPKDHLGDCFLA